MEGVGGAARLGGASGRFPVPGPFKNGQVRSIKGSSLVHSLHFRKHFHLFYLSSELKYCSKAREGFQTCNGVVKITAGPQSFDSGLGFGRNFHDKFKLL
eukprot:1159967-Pelagomonas_calceolata.AAC.4